MKNLFGRFVALAVFAAVISFGSALAANQADVPVIATKAYVDSAIGTRARVSDIEEFVTQTELQNAVNNVSGGGSIDMTKVVSRQEMDSLLAQVNGGEVLFPELGPGPNGCVAGTYWNSTANICSKCAAGTFSAAGATQCSPCLSGTYSDIGAPACSVCPAGFACLNGVKTTCPMNTISAPGASTCSACPTGTYSAPGTANCSEFCPEGTYWKGTTCANCPAGKWSAPGSSNQCDLDCPIGFYCPGDGQKLTCAPGYYINSARSACSACRGTGTTYSCTDELTGAPMTCRYVQCVMPVTETANGQCVTSRINGYMRDANGDCVPCAPGFDCKRSGQVNYQSNHEEQKYGAPLCEAGYHSSENRTSNEGACDACPAGTFSGKGATHCTMCPAGTWSNIASAICRACPAGTANPTAGNTNRSERDACTTCVAGTYAGIGATECLTCPAGTFSGEKAGQCTNCPVGTFKSESGAGECSSCADGYYALAGSAVCSICPAGHSCMHKNLGAMLCPIGSYQPQEGQMECLTCPAGTTTLAEGSTSADDCVSPV